MYSILLWLQGSYTCGRIPHHCCHLVSGLTKCDSLTKVSPLDVIPITCLCVSQLCNKHYCFVSHTVCNAACWHFIVLPFKWSTDDLCYMVVNFNIFFHFVYNNFWWCTMYQSTDFVFIFIGLCWWSLRVSQSSFLSANGSSHIIDVKHRCDAKSL